MTGPLRRSSEGLRYRLTRFPLRPAGTTHAARSDDEPGEALTESQLDDHRLRRLLEVGRTLITELDVDAVLDRLLEVAQELTGARYAALGILDPDRRELDRFLTRGIDQTTQRAIGDYPRGRGILGVLIEEPKPLRVRIIGHHPRSYGFPAGHPEMNGFLGVPVLIRGKAWGNLYLSEKEGEEFDESDEEAAVILAGWAALAIENARLYQKVDERRSELERALTGLEATTAIARALGGETRLDRVLELIVKRARTLVEARMVLILLEEGDDLVVAATAGEAPEDLVGRRLAIAGTVTGGVLRSGRAQRVRDLDDRLQVSMGTFGVAVRSALLVPLVFRGRGHGVIAAYDRIASDAEFGEPDERLMLSFAASAATAVAAAKSVQEDRLRHSIESSEQERRRWARELHDETLQVLGGLQVVLSAALRRDDLEGFRTATTSAVEQIRAEIDGLRALITELRPAALDELGLEPAIIALCDRSQTVEGLVVHHRVELNGRLSPELESTVYRLIQEALTNVAKHANAEQAWVEVREDDGAVEVRVRDDGAGIDLDQPSAGFGLQGMRERVALAGGTLYFDASQPGTLVRATMPATRPADLATSPATRPASR
jgi:signal transduction histidine kinase